MRGAEDLYDLLVESVRQETPSVKTLRMRLPEGVSFSFLPGQWVQLHFPGEAKEKRAYSICSSPLDHRAIELTFANAGKFTARLFETKPGDRLAIEGPYGRWTYSGDASHAVVVTGGTGIAPVRSMARFVIDHKLDRRLSIFYSSKTEEEIVYRSELADWEKHPNIRVHTTLTRGKWNGAHGRIDLETISNAVGDLLEPVYYLCGPNALVEAIFQALLGAQVPRERIHREKWGEF